MALSKISTGTTIKLCTLDVSCDTTANKAHKKYGEEYDFKIRFPKQIEAFDSLQPDVVNLQEVRYKDNLECVISEMKKKGYIVHSFYNNTQPMSFNNFICVRRDGNWEETLVKHYWTAMRENGDSYLSDDESARVPPSENQRGDPHGRCVGVSVLKNKLIPTLKVIVASIHVVPFDDSTKRVQQEACLSLAKMTQTISGDDTIPVIIAGDFNIFNEDRENKTKFDRFKTFASDLNLREIDLQKMIIKEKIITDQAHIGTCVEQPTIMEEDPKKIGTFTPWSFDSFSDIVYKQPLGYSKLDAIFASKSLECKDGVTVRPILMKPLNDLSKMSSEEKEMGMDELRFRLKDVLASDHFLLTAEFTFT
ncbi:unnamed protein product [Owenia fusiformis]|uniref:Uncharacterized protein n=1 Tax=Owenia fusiformis TaxID=6347 RepID=A0A8J1TFC3_OWEFU|nr:unnamed protein product [Owenia fusiformis]